MEAPVLGSEPRDAVPAPREPSAPVAAAAPPAAPVAPRDSMVWRALAGFIAVAMLLMTVVSVLGGSYLVAAATAAFAALMGYQAVYGRAPALPGSDSPRFAELADPTRPLTPDDLRLPQADAARVPASDRPENPPS